jgi:hypothetical protein
MPTLSASDYTTYLKMKAAAVSYKDGTVPRQIQTVDQAAPNVNIINSIVNTSQAAFVVAPQISSVTGLNYVRPVQPSKSNNPKALSTVTGSGTLSSSRVQQPGGLPTSSKNSQGTYTRLPQNAGWA